MCGIAGIASSTNVAPKLLNSLLNLEYRGYDSCGMAIISNGQIFARKDKGPVAEVDQKHQFQQMIGVTGIAHTRWATTGIPDRINAHPHMSCNGDFALIHNGIISNYRELRSELQKSGHTFLSQTDTEVLVHLIEHHFNATQDIEKAIRASTSQIEGTFAYAFITTHFPDHIFCARKESPLIIGLGDGENYIGSDHNALLNYTRRVITILDNEYVMLNRNTVIIKNLNTGEPVRHDVTWLDWDPELSKKGGFPHYMLKEIHEQPSTVETVLKIEKNLIASLRDAILESDKTYLIGVGTTYYVSLISQYYFHYLTGRFLPVISSDEFQFLGEVNKNSLVIAFSQSGETYDTLQALRYAKRFSCKTAGVINVLGSSLVREVDIPIMQGSGPEICVLSTKAALAQILVAIRTANELGLATGYLDRASYDSNCRDMDKMVTEIRLVINECKGLVNNIARKYSSILNWLFIGKGVYTGIALEAALKMKEVSYRHAEGLPGGFMKHGTIALIDDSIGSMFFLPPKSAEKDLYDHSLANAEEIKARNGLLVGFGFGNRDSIFNDQIRLPETNPISAPILLLVLGQLFAYYSAVALNRNVDRPRSLAKSVTVA